MREAESTPMNLRLTIKPYRDVILQSVFVFKEFESLPRDRLNTHSRMTA